MQVRRPLEIPRQVSGVCLAVLLPIMAFSCCFHHNKIAFGAEPEVVALWPDKEDGSNGAPGALGNDAGDRPRLEFYPATTSGEASAEKTPCVIVVPGGGYGGLAADHEGVQMAKWLNSLGVSAGVCMYRHRNSGKGYGYPYPIMDVQRAIRLVRARQVDWNIDPARVGILGFSAGGHLTTSVCTTAAFPTEVDDQIEEENSRPDFAIVCYPVIAFGRPYTHLGSQRNLLGADASEQQLVELSTDNRVDEKTPPTFLWHTLEDKVVPVQNALVYYQALVENGVSAELHVFENGRHGLGLARDTPGADLWPELCATWMRRHGWLK